MISHRPTSPLKLIALLGLSSLCALADSIAYNVTPIMTPAGMTGITLSGINDAGQIAGQGTLSGALDVFIATTSGDTLIPLQAGSSNLAIGDINSTGQVGGTYAPSGALKAFEADTTNGVTTFSATSQYLGYSINDSGNVSGHVSAGATIFSSSGNTTFADPSGYTSGYAFGINNENEVAGYLLSGGSAFPFYSDLMGNIQVIPNISNARAYAINNSGLVVGYAGSGTTTAWTYDGSTLTTINTGSSINSVTYGAVNDSGQVVGATNGSFGWTWTASGGAVPLNTLVSPDWNITAAYSISNSGLILAKGSLDGGASQWVELSPVGTPEPGTIGLMIGGCLLCGFLTRRSKSLSI